MATRLESLRVEASLDASKYAAGAQQKVAADQRMVASSGSVDAAVTTTERRLATSGSQIDRLTRSLDPAAAAQAKFSRAQGTINRALEQGRIPAAEAARLTELARRRYLDFAPAAAAGAAATTRFGDASVQATRNVRAFSSSMLIGRAAVTQNATSMSSAIASLSANVQGLAAFLTNPWTIAIGVFTAGMIAAALRADSLNTESRKLDVAIRAMGKGAEISAGQLQDLVARMKEAGLSRSDAAAAITAGVRVPGASLADITAAAGAAPDYAAAYGVSVSKATEQLAAMGVTGYAAIKKVHDATDALTTAQAVQIYELTKAGDTAKAAAIAYEALGDRIEDAAEKSETEWGRALRELKSAVTDLFDNIAQGATGQIALEVLLRWPTRALSGESILPRGYTLEQAQKDLEEFNRSGGPLSAPWLLGLFGIDTGTAAPPPAPAAAATRFPSPLPKPPAPGAGGNTAGEVDVAIAARQYRDLAEAQRASADVRSIEIARVKAEQEAIEKGYSAKAKDGLITLRMTEARDKLAQSAADSLAGIEAETEGLLAVADAYGVSLAAGIAAEAQMKAQAERAKNAAVDEQALAQAIRDRSAAQSLVDAVKTVDGLTAQADAAERAVVAARHGSEASQEAARIIEFEAFERKKLAEETDETADAIKREIAAYDAESKRRLDAQQQLARETALRKAANDAEIANLQARAAQITDPEAANAARIQIERQQVINQLVEEYGTIAEGTGKKLLEMWDQRALAEDQTRFWTDVRGAAASAAADVKTFFLDAFVNVNEGGRSTFDDLWEGVLAAAKRLAVNIVATFAEQRIILPITMAVVGAIPGAFGVAGSASAAQAAAASGGGGLLDFGNLFGLGSLLTSGFQSQFLGNALVDVGQFLGLGVGAQAFLGNAGLNSPFGFLGGLTANLLGLGGGGIASTLLGGAGSLIGGGIGASIGTILGLPGGPVGAAIGGFLGTALGGLFGGKSSVGPNSSTAILMDAQGRLILGPSGADNGATTAGTIAEARKAIDAVNALLATFDLSLTGGKPYTGGTFAGFYGIGAGQAAAHLPGSAQAYVNKLVKERRFASEDPIIAQILANTAAKTVEDLVADLQFGAQFADLATGAEQAEAAIRSITDRFEEMRERAQALGLPLERLAEAEAKALDDLELKTRLSLASLQQQVEGALGITALTQLQAGLDLSPLSPLSPQNRFDSARAAYEAIRADALGGDIIAVSQFPGAFQSYLSEARGYLGGASQAYADIFRTGNEELGQIIERQREQQTEILGQFTISIKEAMADQIEELKRQTKVIAAELRAVKDAIEKARAA